MSKIIILPILILLATMACNSDSLRNRQIQHDIDWEIKNQEIIRENISVLKNELEQIFARSLKYRFPDVLPIEPGRIPLKIKDVPYLKAIEFKFITTQKVDIIFSYKSEEKIKPLFSVFFFSEDGINILRYDVDHRGMFSSAIKAGKEKDEKEQAVLTGTKLAHYFLIQEIKG